VSPSTSSDRRLRRSVLYLDVVFVRMLDKYDDIVMDGAQLSMELPAVVNA
jgi:hypothetical protein